MAIQKFLTHSAGNITEVAAIDESAGSGDAGKLIAVGADGYIDDSFLKQTPAVVMTASEDIAAGDLINIWSDAGTPKVRKATNAAVGTRADGYANAGILEDASGTVILGEGVITGLSSLTPGARYYLGTGGSRVLAASLPTSTGNISQQIGVAKSATELAINIQEPIVLA